MGFVSQVHMTLHGKGTDGGKYLAVALSTDAVMGNDLVFACIPGSDVVAGFNPDKSNELGVRNAGILTGGKHFLKNNL